VSAVVVVGQQTVPSHFDEAIVLGEGNLYAFLPLATRFRIQSLEEANVELAQERASLPAVAQEYRCRRQGNGSPDL
jgi:hypothetical protein